MDRCAAHTPCIMLVVQALFGVVLAHCLVWALSERRDAVRWRFATAGIGLQLALVLLLTRWPPMSGLFDLVNVLMTALQNATEAGTRFLFSYLGGGPAPFEATRPDAAYVLALRALPLIIVVSALAQVLTYWRVLPYLVRLFALALQRAFGLGGALGLSAAANLFVDMTKAPLLVRPYLARMSRSELFALMSTGMATIAGTVFVLYASVLDAVLTNAAGHLFTASLMGVPAAIAYSLIMIPPTGQTTAEAEISSEDQSTFDALTRGMHQGLYLYLNIVAMLLVLVSLVHLANMVLGLVTLAGAPLSLQQILGWMMAPVCWLMGIPWPEAIDAGALLGIKVILNELIAYFELVNLPAETFTAHTRLIMSYALCGFANLGSLGMLIGGLTLLVPGRRAEIIQLGLRSILVGVLATCTTGAIVGMIAI